MAPECSGALSGKFECLRALRGSVGVCNAGEGLPGGLALPGQGSREWGTGVPQSCRDTGWPWLLVFELLPPFTAQLLWKSPAKLT